MENPSEQTIQYLRDEAIGIVSSTFGNQTSELFSTYCKEKPPKEILLCLHDILRDFLGEGKASETVNRMAEKYRKVGI